jgi:hypothetical protein
MWSKWLTPGKNAHCKSFCQKAPARYLPAFPQNTWGVHILARGVGEGLVRGEKPVTVTSNLTACNLQTSQNLFSKHHHLYIE